MNLGYIRTLRHFFALWFAGIVCGVIIFIFLYLAWTLGLNYQWPIPFFGLVIGYSMAFTQDITLWHRFPRQWRQNNNFRKRFIIFLIAITYSQVQTLMYGVWTKMFLAFKNKFQWTLAILLPLFKEVNIWIMTKLTSRCANGDEQSMKIACIQLVEARHSLFLAYTVGSIANLSTEIIMLTTDVLMNVYMSVKITWLRKTNPNESENEQIKLLVDLVIAELVEFVVPLVYLLSFCTAYFGPNADIIGNIKNDYWQFEQVEDFAHTVGSILIFFSIDATSMVVSSVILWRFCRINLYRAFMIIQKEFGVLFAMNLATLLYLASNQFNSYNRFSCNSVLSRFIITIACTHTITTIFLLNF